MKRTPALVEAARIAALNGESYRSIADRIGCAEATIRAWLAPDRHHQAVPPPREEAPEPAERGLVDALLHLAGELDTTGLHDRASIVRRAASELSAPPTIEMPEGFRALDYTRALVLRTQKALDVAERENPGKVAQLLANLQKLMPTLRQLEEADGGGEDAITIPREQIAAARARLAARLEALAQSGIRCDVCGASIRMAEALKGAGVT